jgi:hypothetical protein
MNVLYTYEYHTRHVLMTYSNIKASTGEEEKERMRRRRKRRNGGRGGGGGSRGEGRGSEGEEEERREKVMEEWAQALEGVWGGGRGGEEEAAADAGVDVEDGKVLKAEEQ